MPNKKCFYALFLFIYLLLNSQCTWVSEQPPAERLNPPDLTDGITVGVPAAAGLDAVVLQVMLDLADADAHKDLNSILVARKGLLVLEAYFNGDGRETLHDIRSVGKSITSTLVGIAWQQGALRSLDQPMVDFFPEYLPLDNPDPQKRQITIRHLIEMRSGFDADDDDKKTPGTETRMVRSEDWIHYALNVPMADAPGQTWRYAGLNTMLLGGIVRSATQRPLPEYLEDNLLQPMGIRRFKWKRTPQGRAVGQGSLSLRPRDMLKFGLLFLHKGRWGGQQVVPAAWVTAATREQVALPHKSANGYGYQWWRADAYLPTSHIGYYFASGNGGQKIYVSPDEDMVVVITTSAYNQPWGHLRSRRILRKVLSAIKP